MSQLRFCGAGGQLVGGKGRLPDDPCEHDYGGCNRLFCPSCQALVRWGPPGLRIKPSVTFPDHKALFASAAWTGLKFVEQVRVVENKKTGGFE